MQNDKSGNQILPLLRLFVVITVSLVVFLRWLYEMCILCHVWSTEVFAQINL